MTQQTSMRIHATAATYNRFVREGGLERVLRRALACRSADERRELDLHRFTLGEPLLDAEASRRRGETYGAPLQIDVVRSVLEGDDERLEPWTVVAVEERSLALGIVPLMTDDDTLVLDGVDHAIAATAKDLPGLRFEKGSALLTPYRGAPLRFGVDRGLVTARLDGGPKLHATVLLRALWMDRPTILRLYYDVQMVHLAPGGALELAVDHAVLPSWVAAQDVRAPGAAEVLVPLGSRLSRQDVERLERAGVTRLPATTDDLVGCVFFDDVVDESTGEVLYHPQEPVTGEAIARMREVGVEAFQVIWPEDPRIGPTLHRTLQADGFDRYGSPAYELCCAVDYAGAAQITAARHLRGVKGCEDQAARELFLRLLTGYEARFDLLEAGRREMEALLYAGAPLGEEDRPTDGAALVRRDVQEIIREVLVRRQPEGLAREVEGAEADRWAEEKLVELVFRLDVEPPAAGLRQRLLDAPVGLALGPEDLAPTWSWASARRAERHVLRAEDIEALRETYDPGLPQVRLHGAYRLDRLAQRS